MKDNRLRIPNITRNLYISLSVLEIITKLGKRVLRIVGHPGGRGAQLYLLKV